MMIVTTFEDVTAPYDGIFLAGPTARTHAGREPWGDVRAATAWRVRALELLRDCGWKGNVYVPEWRDQAAADKFEADPTVQYRWEQNALSNAACVLFWVPRARPCMLGLTTNIEFGMLANSGRVVFGAPPEAEDVAYMRWMAGECGVPTADTLVGTVHRAVLMAAARIR